MPHADALRSRRPRILMAGMSNLDHIWSVAHFPPTASRTPATGYRRQGGGPAATAAVAAARLGAAVELWSFHGDDDAGASLTRELEREGIDVSNVRTVPGATTPVSAVLVTPEGERHIFPHRDVASLDRASGWLDERLDGCAAVLFDGRYPALCSAVATAANDRAIPTIADLGDTAAWDLAPRADHLVVPLECARAVSGIDSPALAAPGVRQRTGQVVGITCGGDGSWFLVDGEPVHVPAPTVDRVVDTTGAGDVFHGAYAFGVACGWSPLRSAAVASAAAALKCRSPGGRTGIPTWEALQQFAATRPEVQWALDGGEPPGDSNGRNP
jgi:sulfofructose kinase